jgi:hypothetical protein
VIFGMFDATAPTLRPRNLVRGNACDDGEILGRDRVRLLNQPPL